MNIGSTIRMLRKQKNLSQVEFAKKCDLTQATLSPIENGTSRPKDKSMERICKVLGVPEFMIYILSAKAQDVPEDKREEFEKYYPLIKEMMLALIEQKKP